MVTLASGKGALTYGLSKREAQELCWAQHIIVGAEGHWLMLNRQNRCGFFRRIIFRGEKIRIDIRHTLWELEHGPKPKGVPLMFCPDEQHCINPEHQTLREPEDPVARFMRKVKKLPGENGCWIWKGTTRRINKRSLPYGFFNPTRSTCIAAYRYAYQIFKGPLPQEAVLDHICHQTLCVNPDHLRVTDSYGNAQNRLPTQKGAAIGLTNITLSKKKGQYRLRVALLAHGVRHTVPRDLFLVELPHAEWLAQFLRDKYHEGSLEWRAAYLISAQSDAEKTVLPLLRKSFEAVKELYSSPMMKSLPEMNNLWALLRRYRTQQLSTVRRGPKFAKNTIWPSPDPLCLYYETPLKETLEQRFLRLASKTAGPKGCWQWLGKTGISGGSQPIPSLYMGEKRLRATHFSYERFVGDIPPNHYVRRICENPLCVSPHHLVLTTIPGTL